MYCLHSFGSMFCLPETHQDSWGIKGFLHHSLTFVRRYSVVWIPSILKMLGRIKCQSLAISWKKKKVSTSFFFLVFCNSFIYSTKKVLSTHHVSVRILSIKDKAESKICKSFTWIVCLKITCCFQIIVSPFLHRSV